MSESKAEMYKAGYEHGDRDRKGHLGIAPDLSLYALSYRHGYRDGLAAGEFKPSREPAGRANPRRREFQAQEEPRAACYRRDHALSGWREERSAGWWHGGE